MLASVALVLVSERAQPVSAADIMVGLQAAPTRSDTLAARLAEGRLRVVPALGQEGAELGEALARLSAALAEPDRRGLGDAVAGVDAALARLKSGGGARPAADLGAVETMLADARRLVPLVAEGRR